MELATQKIKLSMLNLQYKIASSFGSAEAKQRLLEARVVLRTAVMVSQRFAEDNGMYYNLLNRSH